MTSTRKSQPMQVDTASIEKRYFTRFWGRRMIVRPKFVHAHLGDGGSLIFIEPLDSRPDYYVIRVDSSWALSNFSDGPEFICDHLDEILEVIEAECGPGYEDHMESGTGRARHNPWPALSDSSGCLWGKFEIEAAKL